MQNIENIIDSYIDTPYQHQARVKGVGVDCAGLIVCVAQELGIELETYNDYTMNPDGHRLIEICKKNLQQISFKDISVGDILLMKFDKEPQHLAFYTSNNNIVHAYMRARKVTKHNLDEIWKSRVVACFRFKGAN